MDEYDNQRLARAMDALYWGAGALASALGVRETTVRRWLKGRYPVPPPITAWAERLADFHRANPPPVAPDRESPERDDSPM